MLSIAAYRLLSHYVPGVSSIDAPVLRMCATVLLSIAAAAVWFPRCARARDPGAVPTIVHHPPRRMC